MTSDERLVKYLTDAHSIEEQALAQLRRAPDMVEGELAEPFARHLEETEGQERLVRERLEAHDASPARAKDLAGRAGGAGMALFARAQPETPGKLLAHAYAYEHMEVAAYELLERVARRAGDEETAAAAARIAAQEREMASRLEALFGEAVSASLESIDAPHLEQRLGSHLGDVHAIEGQSEELLERGAKMAPRGPLESSLRGHLAETTEQRRRVGERLEARGESSSAIKDAALRLGGLNWGAFMAAQPDTPPKLAGFAFAVEHLEIASYELLRDLAERAGDSETVATANTALAEERAAAEAIAARWDEALDAAGV